MVIGLSEGQEEEGPQETRCVLKRRNYNNRLSHASAKHQVIYCVGTSGDFAASARRLRFLGPLRTRAGSTVHCATQELAWCAMLCEGGRRGRRRGGEKEGRGNEEEGERGRSDC